MVDIALQDIRKVYFSEPVLESVTMELQARERIGLLGNNGSGKTTLFKIILGEETIESGQVFLRKGLTIGVLRQQPPSYGQSTVREVMESSYEDLIEMSARIKTMTKAMEEDMNKGLEPDFMNEYGELTLEYELRGGYEKEHELMKISRGMNLVQLLNRKYASLSGGEKIRVELGKLLLSEPDVMLLDEPTNHLDLSMCSWLEEFLKTYKGSVLIISHDRFFLDRVVTKIYAIEDKRASVYMGNYSFYVVERQARYEQAMKVYEQQEKKVKQLEEASKRMRLWASQADNEAMYKRAKAMERRIERMERANKPKLDNRGTEMSFDSGERAGKHVLRMENYTLAIQDKCLFRDGNMLVDYGEHVAIIGNNGTGKSTLLRQLLKECDLEEGVYYPHPIETTQQAIRINPRARIGYLEQDIMFENMKRSVLEYMYEILKKPEHDVRRYLGRFGFYTEDIHKKLEVLSGGEKVRLLLATLMHYEVNVLIMDEPTNHIDIKTKELLETALSDFEGTLITVSHDRYFLDQLFDTIYEIANQQLIRYEGNYSAYIEEKQREEKQMLNKEPEPRQKNVVHNKKPMDNIIPKERRINPQKVEKMEEEIEGLEKQIEAVRRALNAAVTDYETIQTLMQEEEDLNTKLEQLMERYIEYIEA